MKPSCYDKLKGLVSGPSGFSAFQVSHEEGVEVQAAVYTVWFSQGVDLQTHTSTNRHTVATLLPFISERPRSQIIVIITDIKKVSASS